MFGENDPVHSNQMPRVMSVSGPRFREDTIYSNHNGEVKDAFRKRADYALEHLREPLTKALQKDEVVLYVARALAPAATAEQLTLGHYIYDVKLGYLVLTNQRLLHFLAKRKLFGGDTGWTWRKSVREARWGDVAEAKVKGWLSRSLVMKYRDGRKETYWSLSRRDAKKIKVLLEAVLSKCVNEVTAAQGSAALCPGCLAALTPGVYRCGACGLEFKDEKTAIRRTILMPGGGYFYAGLRSLGFVDLFFEGMFMLVGLLFVLEIFGVMAPDPGQEPANWVAVVFVLLFIGVKKLISGYNSTRFVRNFLPAR
ncbi:MAG: hypothetical protein HY234_02470 [Acidobacteria bacterium]|nr:hypothetical protein [Acidobacteriota bacterium]MBI3661899.1 hypothetical protein [Acidobacteriota bacterium]